MKEVIDTNFTATINVSDILFPLLRSNARVVHVSSRLGLLSELPNNSLKDKFMDENLTLQGLISLMNDYIE